MKKFSSLLISSNRNLVWLVKFILSIASIELHSFNFEISQELYGHFSQSHVEKTN